MCFGRLRVRFIVSTFNNTVKSITKEILEASKMCSYQADLEVGENCAVALAVREIFPNAWVRTYVIEAFGAKRDIRGELVDEGDIHHKIYLPEEAEDFIHEFDMGKPEDRILMNPIEFEVEIPKAVIDEIDISNIDLSKSKTLELL